MGVIRRVILAAGTGYKLREIVSKDNRFPVLKPMIPLGPSRLIDFSLHQLDSLQPTGEHSMDNNIYVAVPQYRDPKTQLAPVMDTTIKNYLEKIQGFYHCGFQFLGQDLVGTAGSLKEIYSQFNFNEDDVIVVLNADIPCNMPLQPALDSHYRSKADVTLTLKRIPAEQSADIANYDTVLLRGMPRMNRVMSDDQNMPYDAYSKKMDEFIATLGPGRSALVQRYYKRTSWNKSKSDLADASMRIFSGEYVQKYICPQITSRPKPAEESIKLEAMDRIRAAMRYVEERYADDRKEWLAEGERILATISRETGEEYDLRFYNTEHSLYRTTREFWSRFQMKINAQGPRDPLVSQFLASRQGVPVINAYIMPDEYHWDDVDSPAKVLSKNMEILKTGAFKMLRLEEAISKGLYQYREYKDLKGAVIGVCWIGKNVKLADSAIIRGTVIIGDDCEIGEEVFLKNAVINSGNVLQDGVKVNESVAFPRHPEAVMDNEIVKGVTMEGSILLGGDLFKDLIESTSYVTSSGGVVTPII